ncbi:hypothetical protein [Terriglobus sp.]|uniref:hypothetical protein n=1 Tax=Terriglobus sp. TaxID=1889013 RepID=UPI003AFF6C56
MRPVEQRTSKSASDVSTGGADKAEMIGILVAFLMVSAAVTFGAGYLVHPTNLD